MTAVFLVLAANAYVHAASAAPASPTNLADNVVSSSQINLTWTAVAGATSYAVQRCQGAGCASFAQIGTSTTASYANTGLTAGTSYSYRVDAANASGTSGFSNTRSVTTPTGSGVSGSVSYGYDALGRLIQVASPTLSSVEALTYDAAGNINGNADTVISALGLENVSVDQASPGEQITIDGSGFSTTISADTVTINGVTATVVSATATQLVVTVPTGATSGPVKVTVGGVAVSSTQSVSIVAAGAAPTIASFSPTEDPSGTAVTITGTNFSTTSADDKVLFNGAPAIVTAATSTKLTVTVPADATPGPIQVITPYGAASSTGNFIAPPLGYTTSTIGSVGQIVEGGAPVAVTLSTAGKSALQLFNGTSGDWLTLGVSGLTVSSCSLTVFSPSGLPILTATITANGQNLQLPRLQMSGYYTIVVNPGNTTGSVTLSLLKPATGTLTAGGASVVLALTPAGERGLVTFTGASGQYLALELTTDTIPGATLSIIEPNGGILLSQAVTPSTASIELPQLTISGTYTVLVDPGSASGNITLALLAPVTATVTVAGTSVPLTLASGQRALVTMNGTAGEYLTVTTGFFTGTITVYSPNRTQLVSASVSPSSPAAQLPILPSTGAYTILVDPGNNAATLAVSVLAPVSGNTSTIPYELNLDNPEARGILTFTGNPGQYVALTLQEGGGNISGIQITIVAPDGTIVNGTPVMGPVEQGINDEPSYSFSCSTGPCYGNSIINLGPFPTYAGGTTFTALIQQTGGTGGVFTYAITNPIVSSQTLAASTSPTSYYLANPGQGIRIPITLAVGQLYSLTISEEDGNFPAVDAVVLNAQGSAVQGAGLIATCSTLCLLGGAGQYSGSESDSIGIGVSGSYTLLIQQVTQTFGANSYGPLAGDLQLQLTLITP